jgi:CrcB protein
MIAVLYVALGGAVGSAARYALARAVGQTLGTSFPYGTLTVNILGSLAMGLLAGWLVKADSGNQELHLLLAVGLLGGFTTFSAFSLDIVTLIQRGDYAATLLYILISVIISVLALFAGLMIMRVIL